MKDYRARANNKYIAKAIKRYGIALNKFTEPDLIDWLDSKPNKQGYIKELILKDMKK